MSNVVFILMAVSLKIEKMNDSLSTLSCLYKLQDAHLQNFNKKTKAQTQKLTRRWNILNLAVQNAWSSPHADTPLWFTLQTPGGNVDQVVVAQRY